ncbi:BMP family ABC transporter substrate-binding protein [Virgibacillus necropolis]|uniref:BMP family ABC transporter substrate-binding protein n=1 Tax=Virgibacillus necropolis TaxID=163877 RepID=A0A221MFU5_9BACI|nr:BMP family ABC transporter substrate-binding protein [Virgibacillus necropolis]ASN06527.1 BMP family ABC transporter substrate-binding protein [Virgibacillus necropolis]
MLKKLYAIIFLISIFLVLSGCNEYIDTGQIQNVGMLTEGTIDDQVWGQKGYEGLQAIEKKYDVNVYYKEGIKTQQEVTESVDELVSNGVNLIFGHSNIYGKYFVNISKSYPDVQFIYFNGGYHAKNVTSLNFNSHAMGFFGGMVAGKMTETDQIGIVAAYEWQPEIEGFYEGAKYENPEVKVHIDYVKDWADKDTAISMYKRMKEQNVDVFYPTGDSYSIDVIKQARKDGLYAIGYVSDQSYIDEETVLTSTVQQVDKLYTLAAKKFNKDELDGGILVFDFQDDVISLGTFSPVVPEDYQDKIEEIIKKYKKTALLPNE